MIMLIMTTSYFWQVLAKSDGMLVSTFITEIRGAHYDIVSVAMT